MPDDSKPPPWKQPWFVPLMIATMLLATVGTCSQRDRRARWTAARNGETAPEEGWRTLPPGKPKDLGDVPFRPSASATASAATPAPSAPSAVPAPSASAP